MRTDLLDLAVATALVCFHFDKYSKTCQSLRILLVDSTDFSPLQYVVYRMLTHQYQILAGGCLEKDTHGKESGNVTARSLDGY